MIAFHATALAVALKNFNTFYVFKWLNGVCHKLRQYFEHGKGFLQLNLLGLKRIFSLIKRLFTLCFNSKHFLISFSLKHFCIGSGLSFRKNGGSRVFSCFFLSLCFYGNAHSLTLCLFTRVYNFNLLLTLSFCHHFRCGYCFHFFYFSLFRFSSFSTCGRLFLRFCRNGNLFNLLRNLNFLLLTNARLL